MKSRNSQQLLAGLAASVLIIGACGSDTDTDESGAEDATAATTAEVAEDSDETAVDDAVGGMVTVYTGRHLVFNMLARLYMRMVAILSYAY